MNAIQNIRRSIEICESISDQFEEMQKIDDSFDTVCNNSMFDCIDNVSRLNKCLISLLEEFEKPLITNNKEIPCCTK